MHFKAFQFNNVEKTDFNLSLLKYRGIKNKKL